MMCGVFLLIMTKLPTKNFRGKSSKRIDEAKITCFLIPKSVFLLVKYIVVVVTIYVTSVNIYVSELK